MISRPPGRFKAIYMFYELGMRQLSILCSNVSKKVSMSFPFTLLDLWLNEATISGSGLLIANPLILSTTRLERGTNNSCKRFTSEGSRQSSGDRAEHTRRVKWTTYLL